MLTGHNPLIQKSEESQFRQTKSIQMNKILVTGGCGYIGSHTLVNLIENGFEVVSVDNLVNADETALDGIEKITGKRIHNYPVDLTDLGATKQIFHDHPDITGIIHFAALKSVGESVEKPLFYFRNNLNSLLNLLDCMAQFQVPNIIFLFLFCVWQHRGIARHRRHAVAGSAVALRPHQANGRTYHP